MSPKSQARWSRVLYLNDQTASYKNPTGAILFLPLAYNQTDRTCRMLYSAPEEGNLAFSFNATDRYGNFGLATDAYDLKVIPSSRLVTQRLTFAAVIGTLIPVALLVWAIVTVTSRRRKHKR